MADHEPNGTDTSIELHVRQVLSKISALKARLRAQEQAQQRGSRHAVEVDREDDRSGRVDDTELSP
jgi:hypothetical protein